MSKSVRYFMLASLMVTALVFMALPGCKSNASKLTLSFQVTTRSEDAVLTLYVIPQDTQGNIVEQNGTLSVKLWEKTSSKPPATGDLVGQWDNLKISSVDFQDGKGMRVSFDPNDAFMGKSGQQVYIELDLTTNGKSYSTSGIVILGDLPACCGQS